MTKKILIQIKDPKKIYQELTGILCNYREKPAGSIIFIVEGSIEKPVIGLRYPGKKLRKRELKQIRKNSALWANLYDFEVVAFKDDKEIEGNQFTFTKLVDDFYENKRGNKEFWKCVNELYKNNTLCTKLPKTKGIDSKLFLLMLKWIWLQEDFNYKFSWDEVSSPVRYVLETRTGTRTSKGAGRAKSFAAIILLNYFTLKEVKKIIPAY
jgi:hypothetical protein